MVNASRSATPNRHEAMGLAVVALPWLEAPSSRGFMALYKGSLVGESYRKSTMLQAWRCCHCQTTITCPRRVG